MVDLARLWRLQVVKVEFLTLEDFVAVSVEEAQEQLMQVGVEHCWAEQVAKVAIQKKKNF